MARAQIQYGSQGNDVLELQKLLNQNGYSLDEDGIFGANTQKAVKEYQQKNGLDVDGIVGVNTWGSLEKVSTNNTSTPTDTGFKYDDFSYNDYQESDVVSQAKQMLDAQLSRVTPIFSLFNSMDMLIPLILVFVNIYAQVLRLFLNTLKLSQQSLLKWVLRLKPTTIILL